MNHSRDQLPVATLDKAKFRQLRMALAVYRAGRFSRASDQLGVTQPAVTRAVAQLEAALGFALFERTTSSVRITERGAVLLERVAEAFASLAGTTGAQAERAPLLQAGDHEFRALLAVHEHRSVARAAQSLGLSQPAVSKSLLTLERRVGEAFYDRLATGLVPRPKTHELVRRIKLAFSQLRQAEDDLFILAGRRAGRLRIGALPLARSTLVPLAVIDTIEQFPAADITVIDGTYDTLVSSLRDGDIDVVVGSIREQAEASDLTSHTLFRDTLAVIAASGHPVAGTQPGLEQMAQYPWVLPVRGVPLRLQFEAMMAEAELAIGSGAISTDSTAVLRTTLLNSQRLGLASRYQVQHDVQLGLLTVVATPASTITRTVGTTMRNGYRPTALGSAFLAALGVRADSFRD